MPAIIRLKFPPISRSKDWRVHSAHGMDWVCWRLISLRTKKLLTMETGDADKGEIDVLGWGFARWGGL